MLEFKKISKKYFSIDGEKTIFEDFDFKIEKDDFISVIGSNGAGKSTLVKLLIGDEFIDSGEIMLSGSDIGSTPAFLRKRKIAKVYQNPSLGTAGEMTILENLSLYDNKGKKFGFSFCINKKRKEKYIELLKELGLGLENQLGTKVKYLSGGQRQSLALIMATMNKPELLILDEHTAALDPKTSEIVMKKTEDIVKKYKIPTLMITHNLESAKRYGNRLIKLDSGNIILDLKKEAKEKMIISEMF